MLRHEEIIVALNQKSHSAGLVANFKYDGQNYCAFIQTTYVDCTTALAVVDKGMGDLLTALQVTYEEYKVSTRGGTNAQIIFNLKADKLHGFLKDPLSSVAQALNLKEKPSHIEQVEQTSLRYEGYFKDEDGNFFIETKTIDAAKAIATKLSNAPFNIVGGSGGPKWPGPHIYGNDSKYGVIITPTNLARRLITDLINDLNLQKAVASPLPQGHGNPSLSCN